MPHIPPPKPFTQPEIQHIHLPTLRQKAGALHAVAEPLFLFCFWRATSATSLHPAPYRPFSKDTYIYRNIQGIAPLPGTIEQLDQAHATGLISYHETRYHLTGVFAALLLISQAPLILDTA